MHPISAIAKRLQALPLLAEAIASSNGAHALVFYAAAKRLLEEAADISAASPSTILTHEARTRGLSKTHRVAALIHAARMHIETLVGFSDDNEGHQETLVRLQELLASAQLDLIETEAKHTGSIAETR